MASLKNLGFEPSAFEWERFLLTLRSGLHSPAFRDLVQRVFPFPEWGKVDLRYTLTDSQKVEFYGSYYASHFKADVAQRGFCNSVENKHLALITWKVESERSEGFGRIRALLDSLRNHGVCDPFVGILDQTFFADFVDCRHAQQNGEECPWFIRIFQTEPFPAGEPPAELSTLLKHPIKNTHTRALLILFEESFPPYMYQTQPRDMPSAPQKMTEEKQKLCNYVTLSPRLTARDAYDDAKPKDREGRRFHRLDQLSTTLVEGVDPSLIKEAAQCVGLLVDMGKTYLSAGSCTLIMESGVNKCVLGITNRHVKESKAEFRDPDRTALFVGKDHVPIETVSFLAHSSRVPKEQVADQNHMDFIIFRLPGLNDEWEKQKKPNGNVLHENQDDDGDPIDRDGKKLVSKGTKLFMISHPLGGHARVSFGEVVEMGHYEFKHNISSCSGSSGAPIFNIEGRIVGLHYASGWAIKFWRINDVLESQSWERVARINKSIVQKMDSQMYYACQEQGFEYHPTAVLGLKCTCDDDFDPKLIVDRLHLYETSDDEEHQRIVAAQLSFLRSKFQAEPHPEMVIFECQRSLAKDLLAEKGCPRLAYKRGSQAYFLQVSKDKEK